MGAKLSAFTALRHCCKCEEEIKHFGTETNHNTKRRTLFLVLNGAKLAIILKLFITSDVDFYLLNREFCFIISSCLYLKLHHVSIYKYPHGTVWKCKLKSTFYIFYERKNQLVSQSVMTSCWHWKIFFI